jgi:hypothetical protein
LKITWNDGRQARAAILGLVLTVATCPAQAAETVVYSNDFNAPPGTRFPEWSSLPIRYFNTRTGPGGAELPPQAVTNVESRRGKQRFLGLFGGPPVAENTPDWNRTRVDQIVQLQLDQLPPHREVDVAFDLYVLASWDGNNPRYGPDRWRLAVNEGPILLDTTFSNNPKTGAYDLSNQDYPAPGSKFQTGAASVNTLGVTFFGDSIYPMRFTFQHRQARLTFLFSSSLFEGKGPGDEAWGLDNVRVIVR